MPDHVLFIGSYSYENKNEKSGSGDGGIVTFVASFGSKFCTVEINGEKCSRCVFDRCDDQFSTIFVDCTNIGYGLVNPCGGNEGILAFDDNGGVGLISSGPLSIFETVDTRLRKGCKPSFVHVFLDFFS